MAIHDAPQLSCGPAACGAITTLGRPHGRGLHHLCVHRVRTFSGTDHKKALRISALRFVGRGEMEILSKLWRSETGDHDVDVVLIGSLSRPGHVTRYRITGR